METSDQNPGEGSSPIEGRPDDADYLEKALRRIRRTREFPTISQYIIEINQKLQDTSVHASASELANIILKDYALTNKLLKLVNSAFYGFVAGKVTTVTRAVVLLGHDNVRMAALSLVLFEHFNGRGDIAELKDATIQSFWCGILAKEIAKMQYGIDAEEAFICGLLNQLGRLLVIYHMPHDYREIRYHVMRKGEKEDRAVKRILGVSYRALGVAVARQWNFPESIIKSMAAISKEELQDTKRRIHPLWALAAFTNALARIISEVRPARQKTAIKDLLDRYRIYVSMSAEQLKAVMADCLDKLLGHADALRIDVAKSLFLEHITGKSQAPGRGEDDSRSKGAEPSVFRLTGDEELKSIFADNPVDDAAAIIMNGIQDLSNAMLEEFDLNDVASMSLEVIYRSLACQRAILFINDHRSQRMEARFGYGAGITQITGKVRFSLGPAGDLFAQSIQTGKDLIVEDAHDPQIFDMIPEWYRKGIDARAFIFLPLIHKRICLGAYYADMDAAGAPVNAREHRHLTMLRNQLILAIKMGQP